MKQHKQATLRQLYLETKGRSYEAEICCAQSNERKVAVKNSDVTA
jgi:hypothetical protein